MKYNSERQTLRYFRLHEVAVRLGLGQVRRPRKQNQGEAKLSEEERLSRPVRRLIHSGQLKAIMDQGTWLVREDWLEEYEAVRMVRAKHARGGAKPVEWPESSVGSFQTIPTKHTLRSHSVASIEPAAVTQANSKSRQATQVVDES